MVPVRDGGGTNTPIWASHPARGLRNGVCAAGIVQGQRPILHMLCHDTGGGDGETGFELLDSARRSSNFGVGVSSTLSAWASLTAFRILVFTLCARRVCSCRG